MRSRLALVSALALCAGIGLVAAPTAVADPVEGAWENATGSLVEIVPTGPGSFAATVVRSGTRRCGAAVGEQPYDLNGAFPEYTGTLKYVNAGTCRDTGRGPAIYRMNRGGLLLCSRAPGRGAPRFDSSSNCDQLRRPGGDVTATCGAVWLRGRRLVTVDERRVLRDARDIRPSAYDVRITRGDCATARRILQVVLAARDERLALQSSGLPFVRVDPSGRGYGVEASDGGLRLTYRRISAEPTPDHSIYRAGQQIKFGYKPGGVGGQCTGGFAIRLADGKAGALSAGHCGRDEDGDAVPNTYWYPGRSRQRVLGTVSLNLWPQGPDGLAIRFSPGKQSAPQVERGSRTPITITGTVPTAQQAEGRAVCMAGRTSGADGCGTISGSFEGKTCTTLQARPGDSGGPVYDAPRDGFARAVGVIAIRRTRSGKMCFAPIDQVLQGLGATLTTGP